jgi:transcriptional regulator with XRE-family HTH domain
MSKLAQGLKDALLTAKGMSLRAAAKEINVEERNLRQWFSRNRFPAQSLMALARLASMPTDIDVLKQRYEFQLSKSKADPARSVLADVSADGLSSLERALKNLDQRFEALDPSRRLFESFAHDVEGVFSSMSDDDVFIFWSVDQTPFEMLPENNLARREVAAAVEKGAFFIYMYPNAQLLKSLESDSGLREMHLVSPFERTFDDFKHDLSMILVRTKQDLGSPQLSDKALCELRKECERLIDQHVIKLCASGPAFSSPNHRFAVFVPNDGRARGYAQFPTGTSQTPNELQLSLHSRVTGQLLAFIKKSLREALEGTNDLDEGRHRDQVVAKLNELLALVA